MPLRKHEFTIRRMEAIRQAADQVGGVTEMAKKLGVSTQAVYQWIRGERQVPAERCPQIERLTAGGIRCEQIRPDVEWSVLREKSTA